MPLLARGGVPVLSINAVRAGGRICLNGLEPVDVRLHEEKMEGRAVPYYNQAHLWVNDQHMLFDVCIFIRRTLLFQPFEAMQIIHRLHTNTYK